MGHDAPIYELRREPLTCLHKHGRFWSQQGKTSKGNDYQSGVARELQMSPNPYIVYPSVGAVLAQPFLRLGFSQAYQPLRDVDLLFLHDSTRILDCISDAVEGDPTL